MGKVLEGAKRWEAVMGASSRRLLAVSAAVALLLWLATVFFERWMDEAIWPRLGWGWRTLMDQRLGTIGVLLGAMLLSCLVLSFVDTSPNAAVLKEWLNRRSGRRRKPSVEERADIERVRALWGSVNEPMPPQEAATKLYLLLSHAVEFFGPAQQNRPFAHLMSEPLRRLHVAIAGMRTALDAKPPSFEEVQGALWVLRAAYGDAALLVNHGRTRDSHFLSDNDNELNDKNWVPALKRWRELHPSFAEMYVGLSTGEGFEGKLPPPIEDDADALSYGGELRRSRERK